MLKPVQTYPSALLKGRRVPGELHVVLMATRPCTGDHLSGDRPLVVQMLSNRGHSPRLPSEAAADPERARRGNRWRAREGIEGRGAGRERGRVQQDKKSPHVRRKPPSLQDKS